MSKSELRRVSSTPAVPAVPLCPWESLVLSTAREAPAKGSRPGRGQQHVGCWAYTHPHASSGCSSVKHTAREPSTAPRHLLQALGAGGCPHPLTTFPSLPLDEPPARSPPSPHRTFWVGFQRSDGSSPLCGSSTGGWRMEMQTSPV